MALYHLQCKKCEHEYDVMSLMCEKEKNIKKSKCPECGSRSKQEIFSGVNFAFSNPVGTDRYNNSHDYRFHHQIDKPGGVREQRKEAEEKSHMGKNPYNNIDDVSSGKHFGTVK